MQAMLTLGLESEIFELNAPGATISGFGTPDINKGDYHE
jgi:hypothetical protein